MTIMKSLAISFALILGLGSAAPAQPAAQLGEEAPDAEVQRNETREQRLNRLHQELKAAENPSDAERIADLIQSEWAKSGSDSMDLLLTRAKKAMAQENFDAARVHLAALNRLAPDFAEGWNASATLRFMQEDFALSVLEIERALALEPRHFSAMTGLGLILEHTGDKAGALKAWREVAKLYPALERAQEAIERLTPEVDGREL